MELPPKKIEEYLHQRIPLSKALNSQIVGSNHKSISLRVPKFVNTVEENALSDLTSICIGKLAAWTLLQITLRRLDYKPLMRLQQVAWKSTREISIDADELVAICTLPADKEWQQFLRMLSRKAVSTVSIATIIQDNSGDLGTLTCEYNTRDLDHV